MSGNGQNEPRLTEKQVGAILRRAAEIQEAKGQAFADIGTSPQDVVKIGEELGIDPACLRRAIEETLSGQGAKRRTFWGGPVTYDAERTVPGSIDNDDWHDIVSSLRTAFGRVGEVSEVAGAREWTGAEGGVDPVHFSVRSKDGSTRLKAQSDLSGVAVLCGLFAVIPGLIGSVLMIKLLPAEWWGKAIAIVAFCTLMAVFVRRWVGFLGEKRVKALDAAFDRIEQIASRDQTYLTESYRTQPEEVADLEQRI